MGVHAGHLHFIVEVGAIAQAAHEKAGVVTAGGIDGTVGGGHLEFDAIARARTALQGGELDAADGNHVKQHTPRTRLARAVPCAPKAYLPSASFFRFASPLL